MILRLLGIGLFCLWSGIACAEDLKPQHALAMVGEPRFAAGFQSRDYVNMNAPKGGILKRAEIGTYDNLNPFLITGRVTSGLQEALLLTYDSLMQRSWNEAFTMYGLVAESVIVPPNRSWIEFHLDPAARFHDDKAMTSDDIAFTFDTLKKFGRPNQRRIYKLVEKVIIKDAQTIRFELGKGYDRETVMILAGMPVLPKHYWAGRDFSKTTLTSPLGSGPYKIKTLEAGRNISFERVKNYWAKDKPINRGLYNFDQLSYEFYRDDSIALQSFAAGQVDLRREWSPVIWTRDYNFQGIRDGRLIKETFRNGRPARARFLVYNMRRPLFSDIRVRQALAFAFDFEWINKSLFLGTQTRLDSIFMNSELADTSPDRFQPPRTNGTGIAGLRPNLKQALNLLEQAGWELRNNVLTEKKTGKIFTFEIILNDPADEKIVLEYMRALRRLGITASVRTLDTAQYIGRTSQFDFDMTVTYWRNSLSPGTEQAVYWGSQAADQQGSFNLSGLKSPVVDAAIAGLTTAETRPDLVKAAQKLDKAVMAQWIGIPLYDAPDDRVAYRKGLKHPKTIPLYGPVLESWWYSPEKSVKEDSKVLLPE